MNFCDPHLGLTADNNCSIWELAVEMIPTWEPTARTVSFGLVSIQSRLLIFQFGEIRIWPGRWSALSVPVDKTIRTVETQRILQLIAMLLLAETICYPGLHSCIEWFRSVSLGCRLTPYKPDVSIVSISRHWHCVWKLRCPIPCIADRWKNRHSTAGCRSRRWYQRIQSPG